MAPIPQLQILPRKLLTKTPDDWGVTMSFGCLLLET
jgi:hypothetical protein